MKLICQSHYLIQLCERDVSQHHSGVKCLPCQSWQVLGFFKVNSLYAVAQSPSITKYEFFFSHYPEKMQCSASVARRISQFVCGKAKDMKVFSNVLFLAILQILLLSLWTKSLHLTLQLSLLQLCLQKSTWQSLSWQTTFSQCGPLNIKMVACDVARQQADLVLGCAISFIPLGHKSLYTSVKADKPAPLFHYLWVCLRKSYHKGLKVLKWHLCLLVVLLNWVSRCFTKVTVML